MTCTLITSSHSFELVGMHTGSYDHVGLKANDVPYWPLLNFSTETLSNDKYSSSRCLTGSWSVWSHAVTPHSTIYHLVFVI